MNICVLLTIIWMHFVADFLFQSDWMAINKSKNFKALLIHCAAYTPPFLYFSFLFSMPWFWVFVFGSHLIIDGISSKITTALYKRGERHWFFVVIGLDQAIHMTTLVLFYTMLL